MSRTRNESQAQENNEAKKQHDKKIDATSTYRPAQDMIDADEYRSSDDPVSQDMVRSRKKAEEFERKTSRETTVSADENPHQGQSSRSRS